MRALREVLSTPVSAYSLAVFRIVFGVMVVIGAVIDFSIDDQFQLENFINPDFHLKYTYFEWVPVWSELWMLKAHIVVAGIAGVLITLGLYYRVAISVFTLLVAHSFLAEAAFYLNHYYLIILFAILMMFLPMHRAWSLDARRHRWSPVVPGWGLWLFKMQIEIVLLYAGFMKLKADWLMLEPLGSMLRSLPNHMFGTLAHQDWFVALGAYGVIALHLVGAPLLLFKRTRLWVFGAYCVFHLLNSYTFYIDFFPYLTILATTLFFDPDWPVKLFKRLKPAVEPAFLPVEMPRKPVLWMMGLWLAVQILVPLRGFYYPGDTSWTGEGHNFSWRMMLDNHRFYGSRCLVRDPDTNEEWVIDPKNYLTQRQYAAVSLEAKSLLQFAYYIDRKWQRDRGVRDAEVKCEVYISLNGRKPAGLIDPKVDLTKETWGIAPEPWILPLKEPFVYWKDRTW